MLHIFLWKYLIKNYGDRWANEIMCNHYKKCRNDLKMELLAKIQRAKYSCLVEALHYHFILYTTTTYPQPSEIRLFPISFTRTDNFFGIILNRGKLMVKMTIGPAYFYLTNNIWLIYD